MNNLSYKVLLVGDVYDNHLKRLIRNLKHYNPQCYIDVLSFKRDNENLDDDVSNCIEHVFFISPLRKWLVGVHFVSTFMLILNIKKTVFCIRKNSYDVINIHFPYWLWNYCLPFFKKMTKTLLLSPWGSDVYRIGKKEKKRLKRLYESANYVSGLDNRFMSDVCQMFAVPESKLVKMDIGSDTIDYIIEHKEKLSRDDAKSELGLINKYVITCGYNGGASQNHSAIISSIAKVREKLPENMVLLFPLTYLHDDDYVNKLRQFLSSEKLQFIFFEKYLSVSELFLIRRASDMFIHVQTTDANNASIREYLLCGVNCINGAWMYYDDLVDNLELPYYEVDSLNNLGNVILEAYYNGKKFLTNKQLDVITRMGWKSSIKDWDHFYRSCKHN